MTSESAFIEDWVRHVDASQDGSRAGHRSRRIGAMPTLVHNPGEPSHITIRLDV